MVELETGDSAVQLHSVKDYYLYAQKLCRADKYNEAYTVVQQGMNLAQRVHDKRGELYCLSTLAVIYTWQCKYELAIEVNTTALPIARDVGSKVDESVVLGNLSTLYRRTGAFDKAFALLHESLDLLEGLDEPKGLATGLGNLALIYQGIANFPKSLECLLKAVTINETLGNKRGSAADYTNIGNVYSYMEEFDKAIEYYEKALALSIETEYQFGIATIYGNLAYTYLQIQKNSEALNLAIKALELDQEIGNQQGVLRHYGTIAAVHANEKEYDKALRFYTTSKEIADAIGDTVSSISTTGSIGVMLSKHECKSFDPVKAESHLFRAIAMSKESGLMRECSNLHHQLSEFYAGQQRWEEAFQQQKIFFEIKKQVQSEEAKGLMRNFDYERRIFMLERERLHEKALAEEQKFQLELAQRELAAKAQELAEFALRIIEKEDFLSMIETGLLRILDAHTNNKNKLTLELIKKVKASGTTVGDWEVLRSQFQSLQNDFIVAMTKRYPEISPTELKVCTLLRMNLRTKEIAAILHINSKTVENHRQSVRKKMGLDRDVNLVKELLECTL